MLKTGWACWLLCLVLVLPAHAGPQILVVLADHLTLSDVTRPGFPALTHMRQGGQLCLMSPGLAQGPDPVADVYATLGAGDSIHSGEKSQGLMSRTLHAAHVRTALIGNADGDDSGSYRPETLFLTTPDVSPLNDGTIADPTSPGGRRFSPDSAWTLVQSAFSSCDLVAVHDGDFARAERERADLLPAAYAGHRQRALQTLDQFLLPCLHWVDHGPGRSVWLVVPTAPLDDRHRWDSLTPFLRYGGTTTSRSMKSATTQTWGLVAARDIAPSLLTALGVPFPYTMTGAPLHGDGLVPEYKVLPRLGRFDRLTRLNQQAQNPFFWTLGFVAVAVLFTALGLTLSGALFRSPKLRLPTLYGVRALSAVPLALLLAPLTDPATLTVYFAAMVAAILLLAFLPTPALILSLTGLVLLGDGLSGTSLVSQSLLSVYALSGIRFYGIGSEYMGVLIAGALLLAATPKMGGRRCWALFAGVIFVLSFPAFGAKAGGAVTATATFLIAWRRLQGLPVTRKHVALGIIAGFALVFAWAAVGHWLPLRRTHIDTAAQALSGGRFGYIAGVAWRKIGLAARVTLHPGTLLGLLGLGLLAGFARVGLHRPVTAYLRAHARFAAVWSAGLWGCLLAIIFNDSGVVAAILLLLCLSLALLHGLMERRD